MWILYQALVAVALLVSGPFLVARRGRRYLDAALGRLGRFGTSEIRDPLWIHAVSVGEVGVATTLVRSLPDTLPILVTTVTPTGQSRARAAFRNRGTVAYLPFELGPVLHRFFNRFSPRALILVEGEFWPLILRGAWKRQIPIALINGRISDRTFQRLHRLRRFPRVLDLLYARVGHLGVQSPEDRRRLIELGVPDARITTTGNLKYETPAPERLPDLEGQILGLAKDRPLLFAGSTMPGEEEKILEAYQLLGDSHQALLVVAPRHPERWDAVHDTLRRSGLEVVRRSSLPPIGEPPARPSGTAIVLLDSLGELSALYRIAASAFIGGTLVRNGGHNPVEAARFAIPVAAGPSMENFREMAEHFDRARAWRRVADPGDLAAAWSEWIKNPAEGQAMGERATRLLASHHGALEKTLRLLAPILEQLEHPRQGAHH